jgi:hypothetical protein
MADPAPVLRRSHPYADNDSQSGKALPPRLQAFKEEFLCQPDGDDSRAADIASD